MEDRQDKVERKPFGCWIVVLNRKGNVDPTNQDPLRNDKAPKNHFIARRSISSQDYQVREVPRWAKWLLLRGFWRAMDRMHEGFFFLGRLMKEFENLRGKYDLDPSKHRIKVVPLGDDYVFPTKLFNRRGLRELLEPYS